MVNDVLFRENRSKKWNVFATSPHIDSEESKQFCFAMTRKAMKVMTYLVMLPVMTGLLVLSKGSMLIAVSNFRPYPEPNWKNDSSTNATAVTDTPTTQAPLPPYEADNATYNGTYAAAYPYQYQYQYQDQPESSSFGLLYHLMCREFTDNGSYYATDENKTKILTWGMFNFTKCVTVPQNYGYDKLNELSSMSCLYPSNDTGYLQVTKEAYMANQCFVVRNYWAWSILMMICTPYVFIFLRCFWRILFKNKKSPTRKAILATLLIESLHTIGICIMFFIVLPSLNNSILALMFLLGVATIPGTLKAFVRIEDEKHRSLKIGLDIVAVIGQTTVLVLWPAAVAIGKQDVDSNLVWSIPTSLLLVSVKWWENFVDKNSRLGKIRKYLNRLSGEMRRSRTKIQLIASLWKIAVSTITMMFCMLTQIDHMNPLEPFERKFIAIFNFSLR